MRGAKRLGGVMFLLWGLTGAAAAQDDLAVIPEVERLRSYADQCRADLDAKTLRAADYAAYIKRLEGRIRALEQERQSQPAPQDPQP